MIYPEIELAQSIIEICKSKNIQHIVISPGSRNAPLTIGFASDPFFKCYSIADERCAAFFAMGIAQQINYPTAVVCTSGSALLNYYPAVAEAFYSQIPLVVISADRPTDKIDIGDGQTIRQQNVYANHIIYNANLNEKASTQNDEAIQNAIHHAITKRGPVHINAPFEEPLYNTVTSLSINPLLIDYKTVEPTETAIDRYALQWKAASKKLILIGVNAPKSLSQNTLDFFANDPTVVVLTETTSNVHHPNFVYNIDTLITPFTHEDFLEFQPELLVTLGGMVVSKRIKSFLRKYSPKTHWHVDLLRFYDTYDCLSDSIEATPELFFTQLQQQLNHYKPEIGYQLWVNTLLKERQIQHSHFLKNIAFSDMKAFEILIPQLPPNSQLQISNSAAIRYAQLFPIAPSIEVFCNRGTSGIDGSTSTSIGAAVGSLKPNILITGDIGFLYDSNALWNNYIPKNYKIIVINNRGGGIFRILPGHVENDIFHTYFETNHHYDLSHLAKMHGFDYYQAEDEAGLKSVLTDFWSKVEKPALLEINTPTQINNAILKDYFNNLVK
ncbi:2-succinyl-5-enolpyruvyl-6-hydroxy-3-cyclohexene-1-carboxylic-acid synthase [Flavobacterium sp. NKUCC04_CG]|uniref:2-succinyl-5-enolpyruvyl-6-hydroxy-3- cyclohexene-1-carboxylic-acid synthase n=1 Tax=Flavobacterium sp. NKUCC04_CG TaxID=2842121 RepID=UPI001C5BD0A6|nr:2-succinyl-5-enolpyruvyl-6-hydroxy-3-cyclohexene-1-carboxylic-acid synthase [Flavobacterium sp. NKUCC04_CG]MBW3517911.1 2-succinyl-5-enolpyruvyl-6-hydroxy-3-cyclohexene-1-carboxylic-acid synthase [Flavobacterium sp. NKUCC04_CG]